MNIVMDFRVCLATLFLISLACGDESSETDPCESGVFGIYPHSECQMYYNCSMTRKDGNYRHWLGDHVVECPYPTLFSVEKLSCQQFKTVLCGNRKEFKHGCEYHNNQCNGPHCRPCMYDYSMCTVENGVTPMESMPNSPFYGVCEGWRFTKKQCPDGKIFDAMSKRCKQN